MDTKLQISQKNVRNCTKHLFKAHSLIDELLTNSYFILIKHISHSVSCCILLPESCLTGSLAGDQLTFQLRLLLQVGVGLQTSIIGRTYTSELFNTENTISALGSSSTNHSREMKRRQPWFSHSLDRSSQEQLVRCWNLYLCLPDPVLIDVPSESQT